jgi:protocatechuate 3,4-dioxygenase beta subunit
MKHSYLSAKILGLFIIAPLALVTACDRPTTQTTVTPAPAPTVTVTPTPTPTVTVTPTQGTTGNTGAATTQALSADDAAENVDDALNNYPGLEAFDLDADDEGESIVLEGRVQDQSQKTLAETAAQETAPGFPIINRIVF